MVMFFALTVVLGCIAIVVLLEGDPERALHKFDFRGELCGVGDLSGQDHAYWPDPKNEVDFVMCLEGCPVRDSPGTLCLYDVDHETPIDICFDTKASKPFNKMCMPAEEAARDPIYEHIFEDVDEVVRRAAGDIFRSWDIIAFSIVITSGVALIYLIFFRFPSSLPFVIIGSSVVVILLLTAIAVFLYYEEDRIFDLLYEDDFFDVDMEG
jgi:hypothetical protein